MSALLAGHVAWRYARALAGTLALLVALVTLVSLVETSRALASHAAGLQVAALLAGCTALEQAHLLFPITVLLALVVVGTSMARSGELAGLQAQGMGVLQLCAPFVAVTLVATAGACWLAEGALPRAAAARRQLMAQELRRVDAATLYFQARSTWHHDGPWVLHLPRLDPGGEGFVDVAAYCLQAGRVAQVYRAQRLAHAPGIGWQLHDVRSYDLTAPGVQRLATMHLPLQASPAALLQHMGNPRELGQRDAHALIARRRQSGLDTTLHHIELVQRLAHPWSAPLLLLVGLPWALGPDRRRHLAGMLGASVGCIAYLLVGAQVARLLALAHRLPPVLGATAPLWLGAGLAAASLAAHRWGRRIGA